MFDRKTSEPVETNGFIPVHIGPPTRETRMIGFMNQEPGGHETEGTMP